MKFIQADRSNSFTEAEQKCLMEVASLRLSSLVAEDGTVNLEVGMHGSQKGQNHNYSYNYYTDAEWAIWEGRTRCGTSSTR